MESGSISAQRGTLADPEVLQNVPGHVIPILEREFDDFKTEATKFLAGGMPEDEFIKFRLKQGVYGQRQPDVAGADEAKLHADPVGLGPAHRGWQN